MGKSPDLLPKGWIVEIRPKQDGSSYKCYIAPESGLKFQSMKKVYEYLKIEDPRIRSSKRGADVSSTSQPAKKAQDFADFLPEGWIVKARPKQNGDIYKRYIAPSGQIFNSKKKVFEYLNIEDPSKSSRSTKRGADESSNQATTSWEDTGEALPAGWISGVRVRKSDKGRKDSYYIDPVTGYVFHSRKDVFRYLATGEIGKHASKPKNEASHMLQLTDGEDSPSNTAKRQKVEGSSVTRCLFAGQSSNEMTVNSNQMQDQHATKEEPTSNLASLQGAKTASLSILASQNSDDSKKGRLLRSGKTCVTSFPAPDSSADSNDSKQGRQLCSGKTLVTDSPTAEISPDSADSKKGRLLRSGKTFLAASPAPEISPDSDDSKKSRLLGSGQTLGIDLPAPEISPDAGDTKKGRQLRSGKTLGATLPAPEMSTDSDDSKNGRLLRCGKILGTALPAAQNSPNKQLKEIKGGVGKREYKRTHLKSSKMKEEFCSPLRASKRLSGVEVEPALASVREANPLMGGKPTISNHQVLEPVDQIGSALEPKTTTRGRETGGLQLECEKALPKDGDTEKTSELVETKILPRGKGSGEFQFECVKTRHKDGDTGKTSELEDQALEPKSITRGKERGEVRLKRENTSYKDRDTEMNNVLDQIGSASEPKSKTRGKKSREVQLCEKTDIDMEKADDLVNEIGFTTITKGEDRRGVQLECEKAIHDKDVDKINEKPECSMNLPFGDLWPDPCLEFAFKTLTGECKTPSRGKENGESQMECVKEIRKDRNTDKTSGKQECSMNLPFGDSWPDPCLEFAFKTLTGELKTISPGKESEEVHMESEKCIYKDRDTAKINDKPECSMSLPFGDSWPDPCLEFAFKTLTGKENGEVQMEPGMSIHKDRDMAKTNGKPECSMDLPFGDSWPDPCLEFAFKTLTGESKTISRGNEGVEVQSNGEKAIRRDSNEKPECSINLPFGDSWPDPCLEFAFKTLTGDFPMEGDLTIQDYFHPVQTPNTSDKGVDEFCQRSNQFKFDALEKPPSQPQLQKNPVLSAQGNASRSTFGAKNGLQQIHIAGSRQNSINR